VRRLAVCLAAVVWLSGCAQHPTAAPPSPSGTEGPGKVNPGNIKRVRSDLPIGYEVADVTGPVSAAGLWGFGPGWNADPPQCAALADPVPAGADARGLSASGQGGTVYVVVAATPGVPAPEPGLIDQCSRWSMNFAHTTGEVTIVDAPRIDGAATLAMSVETRTVVESGTETDAKVSTAVAYLDDHVAFVTLVTDPGSVHAPLNAEFVADLLAKTVTALRG